MKATLASLCLILTFSFPPLASSQEINYGAKWYAASHEDCRNRSAVLMNPTPNALDIYAVEVFTGIWPVCRIGADMTLHQLARVDANVVLSRLSDGMHVYLHVLDAYGEGSGYYAASPGLACVDSTLPEDRTTRGTFPVPITLQPGDGLVMSNHCGPIDGVQTPIHVEVYVQGHLRPPTTVYTAPEVPTYYPRRERECPWWWYGRC